MWERMEGNGRGELTNSAEWRQGGAFMISRSRILELLRRVVLDTSGLQKVYTCICHSQYLVHQPSYFPACSLKAQSSTPRQTWQIGRLACRQTLFYSYCQLFFVCGFDQEYHLLLPTPQVGSGILFPTHVKYSSQQFPTQSAATGAAAMKRAETMVKILICILKGKPKDG